MDHVRVGRLIAALLTIALLLAGCGDAGSGLTVPQVAPAKTFSLGGFQPSNPVQPGRPVTISFTVTQPNGQPLTRYKTGSGPHTGVHLIIVRDDLHQHPPVGPNGLLRQTVTFPSAGPYKVLVDVYPNLPGGQANFQLFRTVNVRGAYRPRALPPFKPARERSSGHELDYLDRGVANHPDLRGVQARLLG